MDHQVHPVLQSQQHWAWAGPAAGEHAGHHRRRCCSYWKLCPPASSTDLQAGGLRPTLVSRRPPHLLDDAHRAAVAHLAPLGLCKENTTAAASQTTSIKARPSQVRSWHKQAVVNQVGNPDPPFLGFLPRLMGGWRRLAWC